MKLVGGDVREGHWWDRTRRIGKVVACPERMHRLGTNREARS